MGILLACLLVFLGCLRVLSMVLKVYTEQLKDKQMDLRSRSRE